MKKTRIIFGKFSDGKQNQQYSSIGLTGFTFYYFYAQSKEVRNINDIWPVILMIYGQLNDYKVKLWKLVLS